MYVYICRQLHGKREKIASAPAVYFCEPTTANVDRIVSDINNDQYAEYHLNFTTPLPRKLMEQLAQETRDKAGRVCKVCDQYISYECLEAGLFTVPGEDDPQAGPLFKLLMSPTVKEETVERALEREAGGLLSVAVSVGGQVPLIAAIKGGAAESVAAKLDEKLRNMLASLKSSSLGPSLLHEDLGLQRPCTTILRLYMYIY
jgi:hypothetical protein